MANNAMATWAEYTEFAAATDVDMEWIYAIGSGWHDEEFEELYRAYVGSARHQLQRGENATEVKGNPLEDILRYFLQQGGLAHNVTSIGEHQVWQVDGQGRLKKTPIRYLWGDEVCIAAGGQLYAEGKNHKDPLENEEFAIHVQRMRDHACNLGVVLSTSGYRIGGGKGIAKTVERNYLKPGTIHLLLVFDSMKRVAADGEAPLAVLHEALLYVQNEQYTSNRALQERYSAASCHAVIDAEYDRIIRMAEPLAIERE